MRKNDLKMGNAARWILSALLVVAFVLAIIFEASINNTVRAALVIITVVLSLSDIMYSAYLYRAEKDISELIYRIIRAICFILLALMFFRAYTRVPSLA